MTAPETKSAPVPTQSASAPHTNPYLGIVGVFLGAGLATLNARLVGVGLADLRGAKGFAFDEASWLPTALEYGPDVQRRVCRFCECLVRPAPDSSSCCRNLHAGFGDAAAASRLLGHAHPDYHCGAFFRDLLFPGR